VAAVSAQPLEPWAESGDDGQGLGPGGTSVPKDPPRAAQRRIATGDMVTLSIVPARFFVDAAAATTPVDPIARRQALFFWLVCFRGGGLFAPPSTVWRVAERVLCAVVFAVAIWLWTLVWQVPPTAMHIPAFLYAGGSVFLGYKASVTLPNLYRLLVPLSFAFSMGAFFGPLGSLLLSVPALMVSRRSAEAQANGEHADTLN